MGKSITKIQNKKRRLITTIIVFILLAAIGIGLYFYDTETLSLSDFFYDTFYSGRSVAPKTVPYAKGDLIIHFVDVGQGDSIIIQFPDNKNMIIDGGPRNAKKNLLAYIDHLKIKTFDYLLLTHSDEDHCGSLDDVINEYEVKTIFMPDTEYVSGNLINTAVYKNFIKAAENEKNMHGAEIIFSDAIFSDFGKEEEGYFMDFITPTLTDYDTIFKKNGVLKKPNAEGLNSISPVMILTFADKKIMFTGDANEITEKSFLKNIEGKNEEDYNVDILKVGHHGSGSSTSSDFLKVVRPEIAVIMAGIGNTYGHPAAELLSRLKKYNNDGGAAAVYRTDENGDIIIKLTANGTKAAIHNPVLGKDAASSSVYLKISKDFSECLACVFLNIKKAGF